MIKLKAGTIAKLQPSSNDVADMFLPTRAILTAVGNKITGLGVTTGGNKLDLDRSHPHRPRRHRHPDVSATLGWRSHLGVIVIDEDPLPTFQTAGAGPLLQLTTNGTIPLAIGAGDTYISQSAGVHLDGFHGIAPC